MAEYVIQDTTLTDIADGIRGLHAGTETYTPAEMATYLKTQGTDLKPENIRKGKTIFGVNGELEETATETETPWITLLDGSGSYYSNTTDSTKTTTTFAVGEYPLTRVDRGNYTSSYSAVNISDSLTLTLTELPFTVGDTVEFELRIPRVTFTGVTYPHTRYEIGIKDPGIWGSYGFTGTVNWASADAGFSISKTNLFSTYEYSDIITDGQFVGIKGKGVLAYDIGKVSIGVSTGAFTTKKPFSWTVEIKSAYNDFRIRKVDAN